MSDYDFFKNAIVDFINYLSEQKVSHEINIHDLTREYNKDGYHETAIMSVISFLSFLGPINVNLENSTIIINGLSGMYALRSIKESIKTNTQIVKNWERDGVSDDHIGSGGLGSGVDFLYLIESVRRNHPEAIPIKEGYISKAVIKAQSVEGKDLYLVQRSHKSGRYQLIGGRNRMDEGQNNDDAMKRELVEELRGNKFDFGHNTTITKGIFLPMKFVSPSFGAYTLWNCQYYNIKFTGLDLKLSTGTCWITIDEFKKGTLENGEPVLTFPDEYKERFFKMLEDSPISLAKRIRHAPKTMVDTSDFAIGWIEKACYECKILYGNEITALDIIKGICERFHRASITLNNRHENRETLTIKDEYDVQDLLHSLLKLHFEDIRPEEWAPSYAGGSSRMDFLLKQEQIVIEVKKTRKTLRAKELGEQLIVDITKYKSHPDCTKLLCFVYDPEAWIANPRGIENDLNREDGELTVKVIITPR